MSANLFLKRVATGVGCYAVFGGVTGVIGYYDEAHQLDLRKIRLNGQIAELRDALATRAQEDTAERNALMEELIAGEEGMARAVTSLWQERIRRWRDTTASDELVSLLPWLYWQWDRLGSWYTALEERLSRQGDDNVGEYEIVTIKMLDMMMAMRLQAYHPEHRIIYLPSTLDALRKVAPSDPLFAMLEGSVRHLQVKPLKYIRNTLQTDLADALHAVGGEESASAELLKVEEQLRGVSLLRVDETGPAMSLVLLARTQLEGCDKNTTSLEAAFKEVDNAGAMLESYAMAHQASSVLDAHMAMLGLSFVPTAGVA